MTSGCRPLTVVAAAATYFALTFAAGFCIGVMRVLLLQPRLGETWAVVCELPLMLAVSWLTCGLVIRHFAVPPTLTTRLSMGFGAFALLMVAEVALSVFVFDQPLDGHFSKYLRLPASLGLAAQLAFGALPAVRALVKD